jgi:hypothetical protein
MLTRLQWRSSNDSDVFCFVDSEGFWRCYETLRITRFWTVSIVQLHKTLRFGNWISFRHQVWGEVPTLLSLLERANLNHRTTPVIVTTAESNWVKRKICNKNCNTARTSVEQRWKWRWTFMIHIVACFANAGTVEARSLESGTQQKDNECATSVQQ